MAVEPILEADLPSVAQFLIDNMHKRYSISEWTELFETNWSAQRPNFGFQLKVEDGIAGVLGAIYSDQSINGQLVRFCNLTTWCVRESHRSHAAKLLIACVNQPGYEFTNFTPMKVVEGLCRFVKFTTIDDSEHLIPPQPLDFFALPANVTTDNARMSRELDGDARKLYEDHKDAKGFRHLMAGKQNDRFYMAYTMSTVKGLKSATVMAVSSPERFARYGAAIRRHLLLQHKIWFLVVEKRFVEKPPMICFQRPLSQPRMARTSLPPSVINNLYSELVPLAHLP
jgi:hypothetical protein